MEIACAEWWGGEGRKAQVAVIWANASGRIRGLSLLQDGSTIRESDGP